MRQSFGGAETTIVKRIYHKATKFTAEKPWFKIVYV
jgi:hypothetical protein